MGNKKVKVAAIQMSCEIGNKDANVSKALKLIDEAAENGSKIMLLPESFNTEFVCFLRRDSSVFSYAEPIPGPTINRIAEKARQSRVYIIAPIFEKVASDIYYNTSAVISPLGEVIGKYHKTHVPGGKYGTFVTYEDFHFKQGSEFPVFKTEFGSFGSLICVDRQFPECWRILALKGANIIFISAAAAPNLQSTWELVAKTRAFENGVFAVLANRVGNEGSAGYFGESLILSPRGDVLAKAEEKADAVVSTTIDLEEVERTRKQVNWLGMRRPEIYDPLVDPLLGKDVT